MTQLTMQEADAVAGSRSFTPYGIALQVLYDLVKSGAIDYAGIAESQGTYYNTVGA